MPLPLVWAFPKFVQFRLADPAERACSESDGDWSPFNASHLEAGLIHPFLGFLVSVLNFYGIAITQVTPNSIHEILAFIWWCAHKETIPSLTIFRCLYSMRPASGQLGYYNLHIHEGQGKLFSGLVPAILNGRRNSSL